MIPTVSRDGHHDVAEAAGDDRHRHAAVVLAGDLDHVLDRLEEVQRIEVERVALLEELLGQRVVGVRDRCPHERPEGDVRVLLPPLVGDLEAVPAEDLVPDDAVEVHRVDQRAVAVEQEGACARCGVEAGGVVRHPAEAYLGITISLSAPTVSSFIVFSAPGGEVMIWMLVVPGRSAVTTQVVVPGTPTMPPVFAGGL